MKNPFAKTERLLHKAALIAKKKGLKLRKFTFSDLSTLYFYHGKPTPSQFIKLLQTTHG